MDILKSKLYFRYNLFKKYKNDDDNSHITAILQWNINIAASVVNLHDSI